MAEIYFPDGTKLSDYAKKVDYAALAAANIFTADQKIQKTDPRLTLNNTGTGSSDFLFQRSGVGKAIVSLNASDNLEILVGGSTIMEILSTAIKISKNIEMQTGATIKSRDIEVQSGSVIKAVATTDLTLKSGGSTRYIKFDTT